VETSEAAGETGPTWHIGCNLPQRSSAQAA